jgi:hypothetical protein
MKIEAALHGAKVEGGPEPTKAEADEIIFKDPKEYKNLSPEEKTRLTQEMMGRLGGLKLPGMGKPDMKTRVKT